MALRKQQSETYISRPSFPEQPQIQKPVKKHKKFLSKGEKILTHLSAICCNDTRCYDYSNANRCSFYNYGHFSN